MSTHPINWLQADLDALAEAIAAATNRNGLVITGRDSGTAVAAYSAIDIPAGSEIAHVRGKDADFFLSPMVSDSAPTGDDGCSYPPHCPLVIPVAAFNDGNGKLHVKRDGGTDAPITATFYGPE